MGPPRFELELLPPQGRRMPSYPTGPKKYECLVAIGCIFSCFDKVYGFQICPPNGIRVFSEIVFKSTAAAV